MKVGTDGVLLGAWVNTNSAKRILDIGTGTGLIALMIAQRSQAQIDALEIEENAYQQALENVQNSIWQNRINVIKSSFQDHIKTHPPSYDHIITNPPYFSHSLKPADKDRILARHNDTLSYNDIIEGSSLLLNKKGKLSIILPFETHQSFIKKCEEHGLYLSRKMMVYPTTKSDAIRVILEFNKQKRTVDERSIIIEQGGRHEYSKEYIELIKDYYLAF